MATSPDGQRLVASCDTNHVYTYAITSSGTYEQRSVLGTTKEAGFSCAWDQSSSKFAVGCQDGFVCVWDIRKTSKMLARIASSQPSGRGAVRAVKFSHSGSVDLLAFTEVRPRLSLHPWLHPSLAYLLFQRDRCKDIRGAGCCPDRSGDQ